MMTSRPRDCKPYARSAQDERQVNSLYEKTDWRKDPRLLPTYDSYGFFISPSIMVREFDKLGSVVIWPPKTNKTKANPDSKIWCDFHGDYGNRAADCMALRKEIQVLVKKGYLNEYMMEKASTHVGRERSPKRHDRTPPKLPPPPLLPHEVINFKAGGSEVCGTTYSQAKRVARASIVKIACANVK